MAKLDELIRKSPIVRKAHETVQDLYKGKRRKNGDPYYYHPRAVATTVSEWDIGETAVAAALLHSVIERNLLSFDELTVEFGDEVARLVQGVTNIKSTSYQGLQKDPELFRKFVLQMGQDIRAMLIQLAGRLDNLKILYLQPNEVQRQVAIDTLEIHAPLAYRLGMYRLGGELEDLAFPYLYPKEYKWMLNQLKDHYETREQYTEKLKTLIEESLKAHGLPVVAIHSRAKRYSSLYKKLLKNDMQLEKIHDLIAVRIIVGTVADCYRALEIINTYWPPHPEGFSDYIAHPKPNGYRSLHATILGPQQKVTEIQIRTEQMHQEAEQGMAARFVYERFKETPEYSLRKAGGQTEESVSWVRRLLSWRANPAKNSALDLFEGHILVITPKQDLVELPTNATALDFAYKIHSKVGNRASYALINGAKRPVHTILQFGDIVEIVTDESVRPRWKWIAIAKTEIAKERIKDALKKDAPAPESPQPIRTVVCQFRIQHNGKPGILDLILNVFHTHRVTTKKVRVHTSGILSKSPTITLDAHGLTPPVCMQIKKTIATIPGVEKLSERELAG